MRIGIVSPAEIAGRRFLPALAKIEDVEFAGVGISSYEERYGNNGVDGCMFAATRDKSLSKAKSMSDQYGGKVYDSYKDLIISDDIDAVYIPLPPALHYRWAKKALESGKHVLLEKPSTISYETTKELTSLAAAKGLAIHENYMFIYHNQIERIDEILSSNEIGDVRLIRLTFGFPRRADGDFRYNKSMGGGALFDAGGYAIKYAEHLLGETVRIRQATLNNVDGSEVDINGSAVLSNEEGLTAQIAFGMDNDYKCEVEIWGSNGTLHTGRIFTAPPGFRPVLSIKQNQDISKVEVDEDDTFRKSIEHFLLCIEDEQARQCTYNEINRQAELVDEVIAMASLHNK